MLRKLFKWVLRLVVLAVIVFVAILISQWLSHRYHPGSVLVLDVNGPVVERASSRVGLVTGAQTPLDTVRRALRMAENDPRFVGLAVKVIDPGMQLADAQELDAMINQFRSHGKWVAAYLETAGEAGFGNLPYLVASDADEVSMMPRGEMNLLGVSVRELFARGFLDWIKVTPVFDAIGKYKDAANILTQKDFTPGQLEEDTSMVDNIFNQIVATIARHRHLTPAAVTALINRAPLTAEDGLKAHLLDRLEYEDQFDARIKNYRGEHHELVDYADYAQPTIYSSWGGGPRVAVIYGVGAIQRGSGGFDPILSPGGEAMGSDEMVKAFNQARDDSGVRAVIFRVNSPGGSVIASELIRRAAANCAKKKPMVVSMGAYGASGGYWISTPAAKIIADPGTLTGSIGVLGGKFNVAGALQALGINNGAVSRGANATMFDSFTDFTLQQQEMFKNQILGDTYQQFVSIVAKSRHIPVEKVDQIAQGRVWMGNQALPIKLVDKLGDFNAALVEVKALAKIPAKQRVRIEELPHRPGIIGQLLGAQVIDRASAPWPRTLAPLLRDVGRVLIRPEMRGEVYCPLVPRM
ncbi:MAG: signal peptide peptidase SppA [Candidatus Binataceae bacterium]